MAIKIGILEKDGVEYEIPTEYRYDASDQDFSAPGFTATNTKDAIVEVKGLIHDHFGLQCGFGGNASSGRWFEWTGSMPSNGTPFRVFQAMKLMDLSLAAGGNATCTVKIYKDVTTTPVEIASISLTNTRSNIALDLGVSLVNGDLIGVQMTSGSASKPILFMAMEIV